MSAWFLPPSIARFNGAAVIRPREETNERMEAPKTDGFNGAAVIRPREGYSAISW